MEQENKEYSYKTFGELFEEIMYDYESKYEPYIDSGSAGTVVTFYKTHITSNGDVTRKGNLLGTFDPALFWKVVLTAKLLMDDPAITVLYGP